MEKIKGWPDYYIREDGIVFSGRSGYIKPIKPRVRSGYMAVNLHHRNSGEIKTFSCHRLVALNFIKNPNNKPYVNHIDGDKENNSIDNLEWVTAKENHQHASSLGLMKSPPSHKMLGTDNHNSKMTECKVKEMRRLYFSSGEITQRDLAKRYGIKQSSVFNILHYRSWAHVSV